MEFLIELKYFDNNGLFIIDGQYISYELHWNRVIDEIKRKKECNDLPNVDYNNLIIYVFSKNHPYCKTQLIM